MHLGREDMGLRAARALIGDNKLIGVSCYNELERALAAERDGADYIAFGSFFPSRTKPGAVHATPELLRAARTQLRIPVVAIGGITPENGATLIEAGADMLAAIDGVFNQTDIRAAAQRYTKLFPKIDSRAGPSTSMARFGAPYGAPEHRKALAERPQGAPRRRPSAQGRAVGRPPGQNRGCEGGRAIRA